MDPSFRYGDRVRRYFRTHRKTKNRIPLRVEVMLPRSESLYLGEYTRFTMTIDKASGLVTDAYDAGTAHHGRCTIRVTPKDVVKTAFHCGATGCATRLLRNGRALAEHSD